MKVSDVKGIYKLYSADENTSSSLHSAPLGQFSVRGFTFLSSPTAQSNKPHATSHVPPARRPEMDFRGRVSPMRQSKQIQKRAALDPCYCNSNINIFHSPGSQNSPSSNLPHSSAHLTCSTYSFLIPIFLSTHPTLPLFLHSGNPSYKIPLQNNEQQYCHAICFRNISLFLRLLTLHLYRT